MASKFDDPDTSNLSSARTSSETVNMTAAVARPVWANTPSTPHRVDAYSVLQSQHLAQIPTASLREQVVKSFGKSISAEFKWIIKNPEVSVSLKEIRGMYDAMRPKLAAVALRILLDAFLNILGYEPVKWTEDETAEWTAKQKDASSIRGKVVKNSEVKLLQEGFTEREIRVLFAASLRTELNNSAHQMKLGVADSLLGNMDIDLIRKQAVKKAFRYVCGMGIDEVDPKSDDILTTSGIQSGHADEHLFDGEDR
ncbi:hypothetical protein V8E54_006059 [Elaphomyces granulatus]